MRKPAIRSLRAFLGMDETLKGETISVLKRVIDTSQLPSLKEISVSVLGEMGEGEPEVTWYLREKGTNEDEDDKLRLMALTQLGRNQEYFPVSIEALIDWFDGINNITNPLAVSLNIPDFFVDSLLLEKKGELSEKQLKSHKVIVKEFIRLDILDTGLKFRFSETLIIWDNSPENKAFLRKVWVNPAEEIGLYIEQLAEESLSEENYQAFEFLKTHIEAIEETAKRFKIPQEIVLDDVKSMVEQFDKAYFNQEEMLKKLESFVASYEKTQESLKN